MVLAEHEGQDSEIRMNLYDQLAGSPLFMGLTSSELMQIIGQTKFAFHTFAPGKNIRTEGEPCRSMAFLIGGSMTATTYADDHGYSLDEHLKAPHVMQPECLFGLTQHYTRTFTAQTQCDIMEIEKNDIMRMSDEFIVFRLNMMNMLSTMAQKRSRSTWHCLPDDTRGRFLHLVRNRCSLPTGKKTVRIKMVRLAHEIGTGRLAVSQMLNELEDKGLLAFSRGIISIPQLELL